MMNLALWSLFVDTLQDFLTCYKSKIWDQQLYLPSEGSHFDHP
jgi:hypothetical protein